MLELYIATTCGPQDNIEHSLPEKRERESESEIERENETHLTKSDSDLALIKPIKRPSSLLEMKIT